VKTKPCDPTTPEGNTRTKKKETRPNKEKEKGKRSKKVEGRTKKGGPETVTSPVGRENENTPEERKKTKRKYR